MDRDAAIRTIEEMLRDRRLIWFSLCGADAFLMQDVSQLYESYSLLAPLSSAPNHVSAESITRVRGSDLDFNITANAAEVIYSRVLEACREPAVVIPVGGLPPATLVARAGAPAVRLGISRGERLFLSNKGLVENALREEGVATLTWDRPPPISERCEYLLSRLAEGPIVLREPNLAGGCGHEVITTPDQVGESRLAASAGAAVAAYLSEHVPVNLGGCVFPDGGITLHTPSLQLIGIPECTNRDLGYAGNDFAAAGQLSDAALDNFEELGIRVGRWLHSRGYIGAFGIDALIDGDDVLFVEINARFQGSTRVSAQLDAEAGVSDVMLDHLMAWLGAASYETAPLREQARGYPPKAHLLCHNNAPYSVRLPEAVEQCSEATRVTLLPETDIEVLPEAIAFGIEFDRSITSDGKAMESFASRAVESFWKPWTRFEVN